jgi:hypothetical protein
MNGGEPVLGDSRGYIDRSASSDWINYSAFFGRNDRSTQGN